MNDSPFVIYTLHACRPDGRRMHYTGITTPAGLFRRLAYHMHGHAAKFTKRHYDAGASWHLVKLEPALDKSEEWRVKAEWRPRDMCPLCQIGWRPPSTRLIVPTDWSATAFP